MELFGNTGRVPTGHECVTCTVSTAYLPPGQHGRREAFTLYTPGVHTHRHPLCVCLPLCSPHHVSKCIILTWGFTFGICPPHFMLLSYVTSLCAVRERLHMISLVPWEPRWNAFKHVCLDLCQGLVGGETKFAFSSVSPWAIVYISMSNRPGGEKPYPLRGRL